jgi:hypothetical protein
MIVLCPFGGDADARKSKRDRCHTVPLASTEEEEEGGSHVLGSQPAHERETTTRPMRFQ